MPTGSVIRSLMRAARALVFGTIAVACFAGSESRASDIDLTAEEKAWIQANPSIRIHNETNWPPFNFAIDGKPQGYSIDFMNLLADRTGLEISYVTGPTWDQFLGMMKAGTLDVMLNIVKTPDRQKYLLYTAPIADNPNAILSQKQNGYENLEQLFGKTVSVPKGFFYEEILKRDFPQVNLHLVKGTLESMKAVAFGKADAALGELAVFNHLIENHLMTGLVISGEVKLGDPELSLLNIATRKDLPILASILRKAVASVSPEDRKAIESKWISAQLGLGLDITLVLQISAGLGVVILLIILWNRRLRRQVEESRKLEEAQHTLLQAISSPILVVRQDNGEILYINEAATSGRATATLVGTQAVDLYVNPADRETFLDKMKSEGRVDGFEVPINGPDGQVIWALVSSRTITFSDHSAYLSTWTDISARLKAESELRESEASLKGFLDYANVPVVIKDRDLRFTIVNKAFADLLGVPIEDAVGKSAYDFQPPDAAAKIAESDRYVIESGTPFEAETKLPNIAGKERNFIVIKYPVFADDGSVAALGSMFTDITERKRVEIAHQESEALLKSFMDNANAMMFVKDQDGRYLMSNKANADMRGFEPEEMIGKTVSELLGEKEAAIYEETDRRVIETRMPVEREAQVRGADGVLRDLFSSKFPVIAEDGRFIAIGSVLNDMTEFKATQKALEESNALTTAFLNNANAMMMVKEPKHGRCLLVNTTMADFAGRTPEEMIGKTVAELYSEEAARKYEMWDEVVKETGMPIERETPAVDSSGVVHEVLINKFPIAVAGEEMIGIGSVVTNITERNRVEAELKAAKEEAERSAEAKSDFIAVISHEVRTPMNGVLGMARLMLEQPLLAEQRGQIETIVDSSEALLTILNDLLDVSKLDAGKLELEAIPFATRSLIIETANVMASRAKEKGLNLEHVIAPNVPEALLGDANRLRQVLLNLLSNAIKFTDHGKVTVAVKGVETLAGAFKLVLSVKDTGIGISSGEAKQLFSPYFQATVDVARERGGTGLGLSICRQLAELMGGEITLDSIAGEGSTFTLTAPFDITDHAPERLVGRSGESGLNAQGPRLRILMVEDNLINRKVAEGMLVKLGHKVISAENGKEALTRIANDDPYDIVLMDRHMPVMDGIEATKRIRALDGPESTIPIIALTAAATTREIETCLESGMNDVVTKPVDPVQLKTVLLRVAVSDGEIFDVGGLTAADGDTGASSGPPVLDKAVLTKLRDDFGEDSAAEFIDDFREIVRKGAEAFQRHAEVREIAGMTHHSHDMKSCAAVIGLMRFSQLCQEIELACGAGDADTAIRLGGGIKGQLDAALAAITDFESADRGNAPVVQSDSIAKVSHDLRNAMNTMFAYILLIQESAGGDLTVDQLVDYAACIRSVGGQINEMTTEMTAAFQTELDDPVPVTNQAKTS